jgi:hypothetical protein
MKDEGNQIIFDEEAPLVNRNDDAIAQERDEFDIDELEPE